MVWFRTFAVCQIHTAVFATPASTSWNQHLVQFTSLQILVRGVNNASGSVWLCNNVHISDKVLQSITQIVTDSQECYYIIFSGLYRVFGRLLRIMVRICIWLPINGGLLVLHLGLNHLLLSLQCSISFNFWSKGYQKYLRCSTYGRHSQISHIYSLTF